MDQNHCVWRDEEEYLLVFTFSLVTRYLYMLLSPAVTLFTRVDVCISLL